jgi:glycine/D-amino acid oxidase-like deaminating enzyme
MDPPPPTILIIGGGIIGLSSAYHLSEHPKYKSLHPSSASDANSRESTPKIILIESDQLAGGASGKAGGLLAEWAYPACIVPLSWKLHGELAEKLNGKERYGYRILNGCENVGVGSGAPPAEDSLDDSHAEAGKSVKSKEETKDDVSGEPHPKRLKTLSNDPPGLPPDIKTWLDKREILHSSGMEEGKATAQVHPKLLSETLEAEARRNGVDFLSGRVTKLVMEEGKLVGVEYKPTSPAFSTTTGASVTETDEEVKLVTLPCTHAILAGGAWSPELYPVPITPIRAHSVVLPVELPARAMFMSMPYQPLLDTTNGQQAESNTKSKNLKSRRAKLSQIVQPEIYPRPDSTTYVCGEPDRVPLPSSTALALPDPTRLSLLKNQLAQLSSKLDVTPLVEQACFLPLVEFEDDHLGGPIIGESSKVKGLVIATGHTAWGIMNSQATGKLVSEVVLDGDAVSADISTLLPANYKL